MQKKNFSDYIKENKPQKINTIGIAMSIQVQI